MSTTVGDNLGKDSGAVYAGSLKAPVLLWKHLLFLSSGPLNDCEDEAGGRDLDLAEGFDPVCDIHSEVFLVHLGGELLNHVVALVGVDVGTHPIKIVIMHILINVSEVTASGTYRGSSFRSDCRRSSATLLSSGFMAPVNLLFLDWSRPVLARASL